MMLSWPNIELVLKEHQMMRAFASQEVIIQFAYEEEFTAFRVA